MNSIVKKRTLIIGAGQLGSRHLQGLLKVNSPMEVFVLDPSDESLQVARQRAGEIEHTHDLHFYSTWEALPAEFEIVIIATNANVREMIINRLLENHLVQYLILEKVLFQEIEAYRRISVLLEKYHIQTWVNHSRRMFDVYQQLKNEMTEGMPKVFQVTGGNWGLGCNGLHFIDLFTFLASSKVLSLDTAWVNNALLQSKRKGFVEFTGTIKGLLTDNSVFQVTSFPGDMTAATITVFDGDSRYIIQESGTPQIYTLKKDTGFSVQKQEFKMEFQSTLTTKLAISLFEKGTCDLPTYEEARHAHELFILRLMETYNNATGLSQTILPIT